MKYRKFSITLAFCAIIQSTISFAGQELQEQSYWQSYAPQFMQDIGSYTSKTFSSIKDRVSKWSIRKKLAVAGGIITALAAIYNREQILEWVSNLLVAVQDKTKDVVQREDDRVDNQKRMIGIGESYLPPLLADERPEVSMASYESLLDDWVKYKIEYEKAKERGEYTLGKEQSSRSATLQDLWVRMGYVMKGLADQGVDVDNYWYWANQRVIDGFKQAGIEVVDKNIMKAASMKK